LTVAHRPREPRDDPDLHARLAGPPRRCLSRGPSARSADHHDVTAASALARAGLIVSGAFLISRVLGWVRLVVVVNAVRDPHELDAFFAAFRIPDLLFQLVAAGAVSAALIPVVASLLASDGPERARRGVWDRGNPPS